MRYARPSSLCKYSNIEFVNVAGIATASHLTILARKRCGWLVTNVETILYTVSHYQPTAM